MRENWDREMLVSVLFVLVLADDIAGSSTKGGTDGGTFDPATRLMPDDASGHAAKGRTGPGVGFSVAPRGGTVGKPKRRSNDQGSE